MSEICVEAICKWSHIWSISTHLFLYRSRIPHSSYLIYLKSNTHCPFLNSLLSIIVEVLLRHLLLPEKWKESKCHSIPLQCSYFIAEQCPSELKGTITECKEVLPVVLSSSTLHNISCHHITLHSITPLITFWESEWDAYLFHNKLTKWYKRHLMLLFLLTRRLLPILFLQHKIWLKFI